ncbi:MAG: PRC-barrel domain-containing protein [Raoultibacter sp.]
MTIKTITTKELLSLRVVGGKSGTKRIGKVRRVVFHPQEKRCVGVIVKRPDLLWMFRRKDLFAALDSCDFVDGRLCVHNESDATDQTACKRLGIDWDRCVLWLGLPVIDENGEVFGVVGNVTLNRLTGSVKSIEADRGSTAKALLGSCEIPVALIKGFCRGKGVALSQTGHENEQSDTVETGALLVSNEVESLTTEGGLAEKAGEATAVMGEKASQAVAKAKPKVDEAVQKTGAAINKGAYATGKQISKTKGMFSAFKDEYDKARHDDDALKLKKK